MSERDAQSQAQNPARGSADSSSASPPPTQAREAGETSGRSGRWKGWLLAAVVLLGLGAAWWVLQPSGMLGGGEPAGRQSNGDAARAIPVRLAEVMRGGIAETAEAVGTFQSQRLVTLRFQGRGRIVRLDFQEGEEVEAGRLLAELDHDAEQARVTEAEARAEEAGNQLERGRRLYDQGHIAAAELEDRRARAKEARGRLDEARAALRDRFVIAPYAGRVGTTDAEVGAVVSPGDPLVDLRAQAALEIAFYLPAELRGRLSVGQDVEVRSKALGDETIGGTVSAIATQADETTRGLQLVAKLDRPDARVAPGAFATVAVVLARREKALLIPAEALVLEGRSAYVYRVDAEQRVQRTQVTTGVRHQDQVEIRDGLAAGDRIVASGIQKVGEGQKVRPLEAGAGGSGG